MAQDIIDLKDYSIETSIVDVDKAELKKEGYRKLPKEGRVFLLFVTPGC